jgi:hypothetical protein
MQKDESTKKLKTQLKVKSQGCSIFFLAEIALLNCQLESMILERWFGNWPCVCYCRGSCAILLYGKAPNPAPK